MKWTPSPIIKVTLDRFRRAIINLVRSKDGKKAVVLFLALFGMMFAITGLNVLNSFVGRDFMSAIEHRDMGAFRLNALLYLLVLSASTFAAVYFRYTEEHLGLIWRKQLTGRMSEAYLGDRAYYKLGADASVANPDQRIAEDVRAFTTTTLSFALLLMNGTMTALSFSGVLWSISPKLFCVAVLYAGFGTVIAVCLGRPLMRHNYHQFDCDADFRADLIHVRENADSIALSHREGRFKARLGDHLNALSENYRKIIAVNRNLGFFTTGYNYLIQVLPALLIAPHFIEGDIVEFGVITQSSMAFATLLGAFSLIVTQFQSISAFTAISSRLHGLSDAFYVARELPTTAIAYHPSRETIEFQNLSLRSTDDAQILLDELSLVIPRGTCWLVTAASDAPQAALFRATAGLWRNGSGTLISPGLDSLFFLPERPYLPPGTLRQTLVRSGKEALTPDEFILKTLAFLGASDIVGRAGGLDGKGDWQATLSIGDQQVISITRMLLACPAFVCLDRPGNSLPAHLLAKAMDLFARQNTGVLMFANEANARDRFDGVLSIAPDGKWTIRQKGDIESDAREFADLDC